MTDSASSLRPLDDFLRMRATLDRGAFLAAVNCPVLLVALGPVAEAENEFRTVTVSRGETAAPVNKPSVALVKKRSQDAFQNFIWVGRESRCDVSLPLETVSKLQAQFTRKADGSYELLDVGSTNGTWVRGTQLERNKPNPVADGDRIRFGRLEATFHSPEGFWAELGRRAGLR